MNRFSIQEISTGAQRFTISKLILGGLIREEEEEEEEEDNFPALLDSNMWLQFNCKPPSSKQV